MGGTWRREGQLPMSITAVFEKNFQLSWSLIMPFENFINPIAVVHKSGIIHYFGNYFNFQTNLIIFLKYIISI